MYSGGSVIGKALTIGYRDLTHPPLIFTGRSKSAKFGIVFNITHESLNFEPLAFENAGRYPNSKANFLCSHDHPMSLPSIC